MEKVKKGVQGWWLLVLLLPIWVSGWIDPRLGRFAPVIFLLLLTAWALFRGLEARLRMADRPPATWQDKSLLLLFALLFLYHSWQLLRLL